MEITKNAWMRLGISIPMTESEWNAVSDGGTKGKNTLKRLLAQRKFQINGDSSFPQTITRSNKDWPFYKDTNYELYEDGSFLYSYLVATLPDGADNVSQFFTDGDTIFARSEAAANALADLFDLLGFQAVTGYYDPDEDKASNQEDSVTGCWYIEI